MKHTKPEKPPAVALVTHPPALERKPQPLAKLLDETGKSNYFLDLEAVAGGSDQQLVLPLPGGVADAKLEFRPGADISSGDKAAPQCATTQPSGHISIVVPGGLGEKKEICGFNVDRGAVWISWPELETPEAKALRKEYLKTACVVAGNQMIQFAMPEEADFVLSEKSPALANPLALSKAVGRSFKVLQVKQPWFVESNSASSAFLAIKASDAGDSMHFELKIDGTQVSGGWKSLLERKNNDFETARTNLKTAEDALKAINPKTSPADFSAVAVQVSTLRAEADAREKPVRELKAFKPAVAAIEASNGIILRKIHVKVEK